MAGFDNDTMYATNWDFRGATPIVGQGGGAGVIPIGTGSGTPPFIKAGILTSPDSSVTIVYNDPNIELTSSTGDVVGPASSTDNALARFDGTTGKLIQNSVGLLSDAGALTGLTQLDVDNIRIDGNTVSSTNANGDVTIDPNGTGNINLTTNTTIQQKSLVGENLVGRISNTDNTSALSLAFHEVIVGGTSAGSPFYRTAIGTSRSYCMGADNTTANDPWRLRTGANGSVTPQSGGGDATLLQVQPTGEMTAPLNSCATVDLSVTVNNLTGNGTLINPVPFNSKFFDQNGNFDTGTGVFTAPVTGKYLITAALTFDAVGASHTSGQIIISASGLIFTEVFNPSALRDSNNQCTVSISRICSINAGETAFILASISGSTQTVGLQGNNFASFTGASFDLIS